jgi:hypothetical protein
MNRPAFGCRTSPLELLTVVSGGGSFAADDTMLAAEAGRYADYSLGRVDLSDAATATVRETLTTGAMLGPIGLGRCTELFFREPHPETVSRVRDPDGPTTASRVGVAKASAQPPNGSDSRTARAPLPSH